MPEKVKIYGRVKFAPEVIRAAYQVFSKCLPSKNQKVSSANQEIEFESESWTFDSEDEFFADYRKDVKSASFYRMHMGPAGSSHCHFLLMFYWRGTTVTIKLITRKEIERVFEVFEVNAEQARLPEKDVKKKLREEIKVYIAHGRSPQWRDLKDHLQDKHGFRVITYETGPRAGYSIEEVLKEMAREASIAFLIHTGEDLDKGDVLHARENVIHETGLFQGRLGWKKSIVLLEDGCNEFSNIAGVQQLRFSKGNIKEIFGDVVSCIYREFGAEE